MGDVIWTREVGGISGMNSTKLRTTDHMFAAIDLVIPCYYKIRLSVALQSFD